MFVYLANIALLVVLALLLLVGQRDPAKRKLFCVVATAQWVALSGLRSTSVGADTLAYKLFRFDPLLSMSWRQVFQTFWASYSGGLGQVKDPGYLIVVKLLQIVSHDYQVFLICVAVVFTVPLGMLVYRRSADPFLSFLIYSTLFYSFFAVTGIRQTIATALVVLIGYRFIEDRRPWMFALLALVAVTIHKSAVVFIPYYFMYNWRFTYKRAALAALALPAIYALRQPIVAALGGLLGYGQYTSQFVGAGAWVFASMLLLVYLASLLRAPVVLAGNAAAAGWYNALFVALALTPATFVDPNAMRVVQYYSLLLMLLVPEVVHSFKDPIERALAYIVILGLLVVLFARGNPQYMFFWQT